MLTLYGIANSRAFRCLWMLEELSVPYLNQPVDFVTGVKDPEYLRINPNARVPALIDDEAGKGNELVLFESLAINLYLARRYESPLWPAASADEGRMLQWTLWGTNELDQPLGALSRQLRLPEGERDPRVSEAAKAALDAPMRVLDAHLATREHLLGGDFTLADLNLASVCASAFSARYDLRVFPHVNAWLRRCMQRPAAQRAVALALAG